ncbi:NAD(P)/FAD-dependent oxidoreductase [Sphingomonas quercus]|uniref:FAD-binding oxidoreductase n=1 Tax=Sphingomonas quercus TaxID=2842451 RepID=A0ABS6BJQ6_9SPHN|nr:FAD-binding oxidoreductase [Sphingomonas quercus]
MQTENLAQPNPNALIPGAVIVGGGVVGLAIACRLQLRGIATMLVDPDDAPRGASWGNAGHIAVEQVEPLASRATVRSMPRRLFWRGGALGLPWRDAAAWLPFSLRLLGATRPARFAAGRAALAAILGQAMPAWRRLLDETGARELLIEDGHFVVWESAASAAASKARWQAADIGTAAIRDATADELAKINALVMRPVAGAIRFIGSGQIADLGLLAERLAAAFSAAGGIRRTARVARLEQAGGRAVAVLEDGARLSADALIIAGGARSGALMRPLGHAVPIIAERGYHIQSADTEWPADMPPMVFEDRSLIVTRFRSGLRAASFVEFGRADSPPDPRKWARLRAHVAALGLSFGLPGIEWMGARPTLPDYLPAIGRSRRAGNLYYAFGHQHLGLTLAAATAEAVAAVVGGEAPPFDLAPFTLDRFGA